MTVSQRFLYVEKNSKHRYALLWGAPVLFLLLKVRNKSFLYRCPPLPFGREHTKNEEIVSMNCYQLKQEKLDELRNKLFYGNDILDSIVHSAFGTYHFVIDDFFCNV